MQKKNENSGFIKIFVVIIAICLEIFCVAGVKKIDSNQRGNDSSSSYGSTTETTTQQYVDSDQSDDGEITTDSSDTEVDTSAPSLDNYNVSDLSEKTGLLHEELIEWKTPDTCTSMKEVANVFDEYVLSASTDGLTIPTSGLTTDELSEVNMYTRQRFAYSSSHVMVDGKCTFDIIYEDQFYVYRYIVYGVPIPTDNTRANSIYAALVDTLSAINMEDMSDYEKELMFHDYIIGISDYDYDALTDPSDTDAYTAYGLFVDNECVCEGYAEAMELLLSVAGIDNYYINGDAGTGDNIDGHAWNLVYIDNKWYQLDATWDDLGNDGIRYAYFNISDVVISSDHIWDNNMWPECTSMDANYYMQNKTYFSTYDELTDYLSDNADKIDNTIQVVVGDYDPSTYDFSVLVGILWQNGKCYHSVEKLADDYTYIQLYKK